MSLTSTIFKHKSTHHYRLVRLITVSSYNRVNPKYGILVRFMSLSVGRKLKNQIFVNIGIY